MRVLYFDVDGTVIYPDRAEAKPCLSGGALEELVRRHAFERLMCVGNFAGIAHTLGAEMAEYDGIGILFGLCCGAFKNEQWFRSVTSLVDDPDHRTRLIDYASDWWYVDDLARQYLRDAGQLDILAEHEGNRILATDPYGTGQDVVDWLEAI